MDTPTPQQSGENLSTTPYYVNPTDRDSDSSDSGEAVTVPVSQETAEPSEEEDSGASLTTEKQSGEISGSTPYYINQTDHDSDSPDPEAVTLPASKEAGEPSGEGDSGTPLTTDQQSGESLGTTPYYVNPTDHDSDSPDSEEAVTLPATTRTREQSEEEFFRNARTESTTIQPSVGPTMTPAETTELPSSTPFVSPTVGDVFDSVSATIQDDAPSGDEIPLSSSHSDESSFKRIASP